MKCPQCSFESDSANGLKRHMTRDHGGYSIEMLRSVGIEPSARDHLKAIVGFPSLDAVKSAAPETETPGGSSDAAGAKRAAPRPRVSREDAIKDAAKERARALIGPVINRKLAAMPYSAWAALMADPDIRLSKEEIDEIANAYTILGEAFGVDYSGKGAAIMAVMSANGDAIAKRLNKMGIDFSAPPEPESEEKIN